MRWIDRRVARRRPRAVAGCTASAVWLAAWAGCAGWLAATGGCASSNTNESLAASAVQHPNLEGVPLPRGFELVAPQSFGTITGQYRLGKYQFRGPMESTKVGQFYKEVMSGAGWVMKTEDFDRGSYDMRYESRSEECVIRINPEGGNSLIGVWIRPLPRGSSERERQRRPAPDEG